MTGPTPCDLFVTARAALLIAPGWRADLILLDLDAPNLAPLIDGPGLVMHSARGGHVDAVLVEGGRPTRFDGPEVNAAAGVVSRRLWERNGHRPRVAG